MYRFPCIHLVALTCLLVLLSNISMAQSEADYEKQLKSVASTINKLQKELTKTKDSRSQLQSALQQSEEEIGTLTKKIESIKEALAREKKQLSQHQRRRAELEKSRQQQQQQLNLIIRQAYLLGRQSQIKLLLNQEAPYRITRLLRYHDYIVEAHKEKVDIYLDTITKITAVEQNMQATTKRLENNRQHLHERFRALKSSQKQRLLTLDKLNKELRSKGNVLTQLKGDQERLERLLGEASKALSKLVLPGDSKPFRTTLGRLPQPTKGRITRYFNSPRLNGKLRWKGLFITGDLGEKVVSVHHGRVIFSDYLRGHGLLLIIDHGDGYMSLYAHNQALLKDTGDWVRSGETIATLGNTGGQTQAGLYFEIRHNGKPQNPKPWLKRG